MKNISLLQIIAALAIVNTYLFTCTVAGTVEGDVPPAESLPSDSGSDIDNEANGVGTQDFLVPADDDQPEQGLPQDLFTMSFGTDPLSKKPYSTTYTPSKELEAIIKGEESSSASSSSSSKPESSSTSSKPESSSSSSKPQSSSSSSKPQSSSSSSKPQSSSSSSKPQSSSSSSKPQSSSSSSKPESSSATTGESSQSSPSEVSSASSESSSASTPPSQPTDNPAENEILTVNDDGEIVSGKALDIISRIVQNEIGGTFAPEAIKAQAVAAYTHVKYNNTHNNNPSVRLADSVSDSVKVLTASVIGQAVYYNGEIIQAVYSASSAGYTASSGVVWGNPLPYLQCVYCELDAEYDPNYGRTKKFSSTDIKDRIYNTTGISVSGNPADWIKTVDYAEGKYVGNMTIGGYDSYVNSSGKTVNIDGRVFRERIMSFDIRSSAFDVSYDAAADEFTVTTYGYGHGVGLSQNGANNLAKYWGWDYKQILEFYYQGTVIK